MSKRESGKSMKIDFNNIPINSSLGLLALGDIAFEKWRELKKNNNINSNGTVNEEK